MYESEWWIDLILPGILHTFISLPEECCQFQTWRIDTETVNWSAHTAITAPRNGPFWWEMIFGHGKWKNIAFNLSLRNPVHLWIRQLGFIVCNKLFTTPPLTPNSIQATLRDKGHSNTQNVSGNLRKIHWGPVSPTCVVLYFITHHSAYDSSH